MNDKERIKVLEAELTCANEEIAELRKTLKDTSSVVDDAASIVQNILDDIGSLKR